MLNAHAENLNALALLGLAPETAEKALGFRVRVTAGPAAAQLVEEIAAVLARTLTIAGDGDEADLEVAVGCPPLGCAPRALVVRLDAGALAIGPPGVVQPGFTQVPGLTRRAAACYVAGRLIGAATRSDRYAAVPDPYVVDFAALGLDDDLLRQPIALDDAVLVGAGGVGNGFVWGLEVLNVSGELIVLDPKKVADGNLNRCLFFGPDDRGKPKAVQLATHARTPGLRLMPKVATFDALLEERRRVGLAISTVDSREVRRNIQSGLPWQVLDASTTGLSEVVVHSHGQPAGGACLGCIYEHIPQEDERARDIAEALGLEVADLKRGFIDRETAEKIVVAHPDLDVEALCGRAFDSIFKERCGQGALRVAGGEQVFAPFAFISNLAGLLLALELVRLKHAPDWAGHSHYMTLDPWRPPHSKLRRLRSRSPTCKHCEDAMTQLAMRLVWSDRLAELG